MTRIEFERLAETEYFGIVDPRHAVETDFGLWYNHSDFPDRYDAHQLVRCVCPEGQGDAFLKDLEGRYEGSGLSFMKATGHDAPTLAYLKSFLPARGWGLAVSDMMVHERPASRPLSPMIEIRKVDPSSPDLDAVQMGAVRSTSGLPYERAQAARVGGEFLVAYQDNQPIARTGWYTVGRIARFRWVGTVEAARGRGAATTLIRYVQEQPVVKQQDALAIYVGREGPKKLYEELGFRTRCTMWEFSWHQVRR